jgi:hypothetical protein
LVFGVKGFLAEKGFISGIHGLDHSPRLADEQISAAPVRCS